MTLVLASRSPQRRAILDAVGVAFVVREPDFAETLSGPPEEIATANALGKARAVARASDEVVLGVDTVVSLGARNFGKPRDREHARETLAALSGATHAVVSGLALVGLGDAPRCGAVRTLVTFRRLDARAIDWYLESGEWVGRAGGYAIQGAGAALVRSIAGEHANVVGLPLGMLLELYPDLLEPPHNRFAAPDREKLQE